MGLNPVQQGIIAKIIANMLNPPVVVKPELTAEERAEKALLATMDQKQVVVYMTEKRKKKLEADLAATVSELSVLKNEEILETI
jgi:hypothetical protein